MASPMDAKKQADVMYVVRRESTGYLGDGDTTETSTILETPSLQQANEAALGELHAPRVAVASISKKEGMMAGTVEKTDLTEEEVYVERITIRKDKS